MSAALTRADRAAMSPVERAAWIAERCQRLGLDEASVYCGAYVDRDMDPDTFLRTFGVRALRLLLGQDPATPPDLARLYAWEERHPEGARLLREAEAAWVDGLDAEALARLRRRCASGEAGRDAETMASAERRQETARRAEQQRALLAIRSRQPSGARDPFARASAYLDRCDPGVLGAERNPTAFRAVRAIVRGFGLAESEAVRLLEREYAPRCRPPLKHEELRGMVRRALRAPSPPWGYLLERNRR